MDKQIVKHNAAIKASYRLTLDEQRLMMLCITKVCRTTMQNPRRFTIRHDEYCKEFNTSWAYKNMRDAAMRLQQRIIKVGRTVIDGVVYDGGAINVLSRQLWQEHEGGIVLEFGEYFMPYLECLKDNFTRFGLKDIAQMNSIYSIRIYELVKMSYEQQKTNKQHAFLLIEIEEIRRMFELENKYPRHESFRRKVLDVAVKEINEFSPLKVSYEQQKKGRRIHAIKFLIEEKARTIKASSKSQRKIEKTIETIRKALEAGRIVSINSKRLIEVSGAIASFENGAENLYVLLKSGAEVEIKQAEELF